MIASELSATAPVSTWRPAIAGDDYTSRLLDCYREVSNDASELVARHLEFIDRKLRAAPRSGRSEASVFWDHVIHPLMLKKRISRDVARSTFQPDEAYKLDFRHFRDDAVVKSTS